MSVQAPEATSLDVAGVSTALIDLLPNARLHVLSGCGHWTMIEKTADFLAVVRPFLA